MAERVIAVQIQFNGITQATNSIAALQKELKALKDDQKKADPTSEEFANLTTQIAATTGALTDLAQEQKRVNQQFQDAKLAAGSYAALKAETKALETAFKGMAVGINATQEEYDQTLAKIKENNLEITRLNREMRNSASIAQRFKEGAVAAFKEVATAIAAGTAALVGFDALKGIGELGLDLERGFAQVNTVAQLTEEQMAALKDQVLETAKDSTVNLEEVPGALFKILSATGDVAESQKILEASLKAAKVGFTDLTSASDAGAGIFQAVKDQVGDVNEVFDVLFRTQKEGVLTFADLAKGIPQVTPAANNLGISFKETAAALATLTKAGVTADIGITQLKAGLSELSQAQKQKGLKEIGVNIFDSAGQVQSLNSIIGQLSKSLDGLTDEQRNAKLQKIGFGQEAVGSILTLTRNIETFGEVTQSVVEGSLGEFDRQLAASQNTADDLKSATNNLKVTLIQNLQPAFESVGTSVVNLVRGFAQLIGFFLENKGVVLLLASAYIALNAAQVQNFANLVKQRALRLALLVVDKLEAAQLALRTTLTTAYGVAQQILAGKIGLVAAAQKVLTAAFASNPFGAALAVATALAGALVILSSRTRELTEIEKQRAETSKLLNESLKATTEQIGKETANLELLVRGINDETKSKQEKKAITDQLLSQYGKYLTELDKEAVKAGNVEAAYRKIKSAITENIIARQKSEAVEKLFSEQLAIQTDATFKLGKAFGTNAADAQAIVQAFEGLGPAIQQATASGKNLQIIDVKSLTDVEKKAVEIFTKIGAQQREAEALGRKSPVVAQLDRFRAATQALDEGIVEIDKKFSTLGGTIEDEMGAGGDAIDETTLSLADLEKQLAALQATQKETSRTTAEYAAQQKEIDKVKAAIERITGASKQSSKASKDAAKEAGKAANDQREAEEKRAANLLELRRQLSDALLENQDDETAKLLKAEEDRYAKQQQLALDNAAKIVLDTNASKEDIAESTKLQNEILEQLEIQHYQKLNEITADGLRAELEAQEKSDAERLAQSNRVMDLRLETIDTEIANEEKNFERRRKLIQLQSELQIRALEAETLASLKAATSDEERTAIMELQVQKRLAIVKATGQKLKEEKDKEGPLLARILGVTPEELQQLNALFKEFTQVLGQAVDQYFKTQLEALDKQIEAQQEKLTLLADATQQQVDKVTALEEKLATATGSRRERLIALIEAERKREEELFNAKVKQEKELAAIEAKKRKVEREQALIKKGQAIAEATINTAVAVTKALAVPPPLGPILAVSYGVLGAAQIALIAAQKFAKGGRVDGPSHDQGGIPVAVPAQNRMIELEGNEFITNKRATQRNLDVLETINRDGHQTRYSLIAHGSKYAQGGLVGQPNFQAIQAATGVNDLSSSKIDRTNELLAALVEKPSFVDVREVGKALGKVQVANRRART